MNNPKKNFLYNITYQLLTFIIPLILSPYLSRVLGASGIGVYSYTYSIVHYFMLIVMLGVNNYGSRTIAKYRDNKEELSRCFFGIYYFQLIMGFVMLLFYFIYVLLFNIEYKFIAIIQSIFIVSAMIDINWFFFGLEEFKKTITRNIIIKIMNAILIFVFVKTESDIWKYTIIMSSMTLFSQLILWGYLKKYLSFIKVSLNDIKLHIKPNLVLFLPVIAVSLYKIMDKIMLGSLSSVREVGFYENAEKIINMPMTVITSLGTIMLPRISNLAANNETKRIEKYISKTIDFVMFFNIAMMFVLICIGKDFAVLFYGEEFKKTGILIMLLSTTLPFLGFANVLRTQYLIPNNKDDIFIKSVFAGAIVNIFMNLIFIPLFASVGACIGTICAEFIVMFYQSFSLRKILSIKKYLKNSFAFLIRSFIMFLFMFFINFLNFNSFITIILQIIIGMIVYFILNFNYISSIVNIKKIISNRKGRKK